MDLSMNGESSAAVTSEGEADNVSPYSYNEESNEDNEKPDPLPNAAKEEEEDDDDDEEEDPKPDISSDPVVDDLKPPKRHRWQRKNFPVPSSSRVLRSQSPIHDSAKLENRQPDCKKEKRTRSPSNDENEQQQVSKSKRKSSKPRKLKIVISKKNQPEGFAEEEEEEEQAPDSIKVEQDEMADDDLMEVFSSASDQEFDIIIDNSSDEDYVQDHPKTKVIKIRPKKGRRGGSAPGASEPSPSKKTRRKRKRDSDVSECNVCLRSFRNFYMPTHMRTHTGEKPYACSFCTKQFSTECYLKMHRQSCHEDPQAFQCDVCHRNLASKGSLREHKRTHSDERPFQCHICQKVFRQPALLINHVKTHSDLTPYQCELCGNRYKYKRSMEMHKERIHDGVRKSFPCTICTKEFTRKTKLKDHTNWHLGKSPHLCEHCGKRFLSRKTLRTHLLIHEDKKPYPCDMCGKAFRQAHVLKRHVTTHTGIKPFKCDLCSKQFIHRVYLVRHDCPKKPKAAPLPLPLMPEKLEMVEEEEVPMVDACALDGGGQGEEEEEGALDMSPITIHIPMALQESM